MPQVPRKQTIKLSKPMVITFAVVVGILVTVVLVWWVKDEAAAAKRRAAAVITQAQKLDFHRQYASEQQVLTVYIDSKPPKQYQYAPLVQLGAMALEENQPQQALTWYKKAEQVSGKDQLEDVDGLSSVYLMLGNKPEAIVYLRKAIAVDKQMGGNDVNSDIPSYEQELQSLGATP